MNSLHQQAQTLSQDCTRCQACVTQCAFLKKNGAPGDIAASLLTAQTAVDPFTCSLCNLCSAVCPEHLAPGALFLEMRRQAAVSGQLSLTPYSTIVGYEKRGRSPLFSWYDLPPGCDTVFFPGCTLPGTRPASTWWLFHQIQQQIPEVGMALDCCHKPSHDLGRQDFFTHKFQEILDKLAGHGIKRVVVACPNCHKVFREYGSDLTILTVWELLADTLPKQSLPTSPAHQVTIHDPCPMRDQPHIQQAVRTILAAHNLQVREMRHSRARTICCGEGGSVGFLAPELAQNWGAIRKQEAGSDPVITYCAGCAGFLERGGLHTIHLADLLVHPDKALAGKSCATRSPWTYLNRLRLKRRLKRSRNHK